MFGFGGSGAVCEKRGVVFEDGFEVALNIKCKVGWNIDGSFRYFWLGYLGARGDFGTKSYRSDRKFMR